ncbi:MAG: YwaF family protein [Lachnospiraceae bacterium]|nr:YwaF family protein [Lachnospiraceae bacterium]
MSTGSFALFGKPHMIWLAICAAGMAAAAWPAGRVSEKNAKVVSKILAILVFVFHLLETVFRIWEGTFGIGMLPLHVCAIAAYGCVIFEWLPNVPAEAALFFPCLPGDIAAVLFPDWTDYPPFSALSILGFLGHLSIACYIIFKIGRGEIFPRRKLVIFSVLFLAVYAACMIPFNRHFGTNYGFLQIPAPGSPLESIEKITGGGISYLAGYALLVLACMAVWYAAWIIIKRNRSRQDGT